MEINIQCNKIEKTGDEYYVELSNSAYKMEDSSLPGVHVRILGLDEDGGSGFSVGKKYIINIRKSREI